jgi:hypothetical protein
MENVTDPYYIKPLIDYESGENLTYIMPSLQT